MICNVTSQNRTILWVLQHCGINIPFVLLPGWKMGPLRHAVILSWWMVACLLYLHYPFKIHRDNLAGEKKRWVRVKRSEVAKVHYLCQVKPFMLLVQYIQLLGCFHFFKTAAVCSGDIEITL